ncbi:MAG: phosphatase PAP2 family protein [Deltaproteobacteria bacterium]|nr:phosphatase PAP2 family protein [Deltaproteobacteria bacterium]
MRLILLCICAVIIAATVTPARAETGKPSKESKEPQPDATAQSEETSPSRGPAYRLNLAVDLPAFFIAGLVSVGWMLGDELGPAHCAPLCDKSNVNALDRRVAGNYNENWSKVSDAALLTALGTSAIALFADDGFSSGIIDFVVMAESALMTNATIIVLNLATRRARPYLYSEKAPEEVRTSGTASLSFPSGHIGTATAVTTSLFGILYIRNPGSAWPWVWLGFGTAASGLVATGRVMAGRHFITDVIVGGAMGVCMGILVPVLHKRNIVITPTVFEDSAAGLSLSGEF